MNFKLRAISLVCLGIFGCSGDSVETSINSSDVEVLPSQLWQLRNLDSSKYNIEVTSWYDSSVPFELTDNGNSWTLTFRDMTAGIHHSISVSVSYPLVGCSTGSAVIYNFSSSIYVSPNNDSRHTYGNSHVTWLDDDSDGRTNLSELDMSNINPDSDGLCNHKDNDSDNDGLTDDVDTTPYGVGTEPPPPPPPIPEVEPIDPGCYVMGTDTGRDPNSENDERPPHQVCLSGFSMGKYEVTYEQFDAFTDATGRPRKGDQGWGRGNRPVVNITLADANAYAQWLSSVTGDTYRLPSEAEWEYAARGTGTGPIFSLDSNSSNPNTVGDRRANCSDCGNELGRTRPVGSYAPNLNDLYDMHGNAYEIVQDVVHSSYVGAPTDGSAWTTGNEFPGQNIIRGGSWDTRSEFLRSTNRGRNSENRPPETIGFRVVREN